MFFFCLENALFVTIEIGAEYWGFFVRSQFPLWIVPTKQILKESWTENRLPRSLLNWTKLRLEWAVNPFWQKLSLFSACCQRENRISKWTNTHTFNLFQPSGPRLVHKQRTSSWFILVRPFLDVSRDSSGYRSFLSGAAIIASRAFILLSGLEMLILLFSEQ